MAKKTRSGYLFSACAFLLAAILFAAYAFLALNRANTTFDTVLKITAPVAMLIASIIQFVRASRLPRETE